jgi:hypothetical protein
LNEIEKTFPDYYEANRAFPLAGGSCFKPDGAIPRGGAKTLSDSRLDAKGLPGRGIEKEFFLAKAADYQKLGWLDADYRAAQEPIRKPAAPSKKKNFLGYTIGSLLILPIFLIAVFHSRRKRLHRVKAIMKR